MDFIDECHWRGYFYQCTSEVSLKEKMKSPITAYVGFDCTASSLHVGNLMQIMLARLLQKYGHKPIILIGGVTTKIGDPSGRQKIRKLLASDEVDRNIKSIKNSLSRFIKFGDGSTDAIMVDNSSWLERIKYTDFLSEIGRLFSVNRMMTMDSVKSRLESGSLSFLEFNYMLLQAYDFYHLYKEFNCSLQLGGSDQWGNIVMGIELIRRMTSQESFGLTTPLITTSSGAKMGKSANGAIWLDEKLLSPYEYYQYWRNSDDSDIVNFAKYYCDFDEEELSEFEILAQKDINKAKKILAYEVTKICHGKDNADIALDTAVKTFEQGVDCDALPTFSIRKKELNEGVEYTELLCRTKLATSKTQARKLIRGNGGKINSKLILDESLIINQSFIKNGIIKLSSGKKRHVLLKVED